MRWLRALAVTAALLPVAAAAAVEVEPSRLELTLSSEDPTRGQLQVTNHSAKTVGVRITAGAYRYIQPIPPLPSCQDWLSFKPDRFTLAAGATTTVLYSVLPPSNLLEDTAGEYVGAIQVDQLPPEENGPSPAAASSHLTIVPRLALPVYLMVKGRESFHLEISRVEAKLIQTSLLRIDTTLKNLGTVHIRPSGTFALFRSDGELFRTTPLGKSIPILPGGSLTLSSLLPQPPRGRYRLVTTVELPDGKALQKETPFEITEENRLVQGKHDGESSS